MTLFTNTNLQNNDDPQCDHFDIVCLHGIYFDLYMYVCVIFCYLAYAMPIHVYGKQ